METVGQWLKERLQREHLSPRKAEARTGLSHTTISKIIGGNSPLPETIRKLAQGFGGDGPNQKLALEDKLLTLAGHRTPRPEGEEPSVAYATLMDKVSKFNDRQLEMIYHFADYLTEIEVSYGK